MSIVLEDAVLLDKQTSDTLIIQDISSDYIYYSSCSIYLAPSATLGPFVVHIHGSKLIYFIRTYDGSCSKYPTWVAR